MSHHVIALDSIHEGEQIDQFQRLHVQWTKERCRFFDRKYLLDRCLGTFLLIVFSPLILLLWVLVKLTSRGPGFYHQTRVGLNGNEFEVFKMRSMRIDAESDGQAVWCKKGDDRITWFGRILRKLHLDEWPQLLNVARGEMCLIGPRPERPAICNELKNCIEGYDDRLLVKPGITGQSQINLPPDTSLSDVRNKQILDLHYINETNWWLEIRILFATALRVIGIKGDFAMKSMGLCRQSILEANSLASKPEGQVRSNDRRSSRVRSLNPLPTFSNGFGDEGSDLDLDGDFHDSPSGIGSGTNVGLPR